MALVELKSRMYEATRFYINTDHVIAVYMSANGCNVVTTQIGPTGQNVHVPVDEPINRVLAKLNLETKLNHETKLAPLLQSSDTPHAITHP